MTKEGVPSVAFRWMEIEGPLSDETSDAGYRLLFGDLPLRRVARGQPGVTVQVVDNGDNRETGRRAGVRIEPMIDVAVDVATEDPAGDARRLLNAFVARAYRRPPAAGEADRFIALAEERRAAGLSFAEAMLAGYTAVLASPGFVFLEEKPGRLDDYALATRLALFLWNSPPDDALRAQIHSKQSEALLREGALAGGMVLMREDGERLVQLGITRPEELLRVTRD